jgi:hypothetical protein
MTATNSMPRRKHAFEALVALIDRIVHPQDNVLASRDRRLPAAEHARYGGVS